MNKTAKQSQLEQQCEVLAAKNRELEQRLAALQHERAEQQSVELSRTVLESSQDCVKLLSIEGQLEYMNRNGMALMDIDDFEPFKNQFYWELWAAETQSEIRTAVRTALTGETARFQGLCPTTKGIPKWWDVMVSPVCDSSGKVIRLLSVSRDITDEKTVQQEREELLVREQRAHATAAAANRAKDEFLAIVSHELRAPLNAMLGWAKVLKSGKYKPETLAHAIDVIEHSARSQQQLIEDLLDSSRIISGNLRLEMQPLDLTMVIERALDTMRPAAEAKSISFETVYLAETDVITGDPERLQQVVWNLVSNAVKFTPSGGHVTLRLERVDPYLQLIVSDTGKGINPDFLPYVFDRFHQADSSSTRRFSGLGLGLALVRHLVELHGGAVSVDSPGEGLGTSFTIKLPLRAVRPSGSEAALVDSNMSFGLRILEGLRLLVVDDESDARDLIALMLEQQGAEITVAGSSEEALTVMKNNGADFDCLVSDIGMADQDGYELMRHIRALAADQGGRVPAIALTAYGRARDRIAALSAGFQMHVPKPVEPNELTMVIAGLTGRVGKGMTAG